MLSLLFALLLSASLAAPFTAWVDESAIRIQVSPDTTLLRPLKDSARITVDIDEDGRGSGAPLDLSILLTAPPPGNLVSTDFPLIEGTRLVEMKLAGVTGALSWDYVFPIRGTYRLEVSATDAQGRRLQGSRSVQVRENRTKTAFLAAFVAALFLLGFIAGRIFTVPAGVVAVLAIVLLYSAGGNGILGAETVRATALDGKLTVTPSLVGHPSTIRWRGTHPGSEEAVPAAVTLRIVQLEKGREIFRLNRAPTRGTLDLVFHFVDASPHTVSVVATPRGGQPATEVTRTVQVESDTAQFGARVRPVVLFLLVVLAGLVAGRISKKRFPRLPWAGRRTRLAAKEAS